MNFNNNQIQKMLASNSRYNKITQNELVKITHFVNDYDNNEFNNIDEFSLNSNAHNTIPSAVFNDTWSKILPVSCKFVPLYFTPTYPWTYRMSAEINNYFFGKKSIHNLLTFNINLPVKHQLRGSYFFSNYDTTNYGKLKNKKIDLYRIYPSLLSENVVPCVRYIYKHAVTGLNLAYLPLNKYSNMNLSGNFWFDDAISNSFLRKYYNIQPYNIMSREIDSVISLFDNKLSFIFDPMSAVYNLQRAFTLGLSPTSKVFMPEKYLRSNDVFYRRFNLWSQKYYEFWNKIHNFNSLNYDVIYKMIDKYMTNFNSGILYNMFAHIQIKSNFVVTTSGFNKTQQIHLLANKPNALGLSQNLNCRVNSLYTNNIAKISHKKPLLFIDIKQGNSLISNLVFSTKTMAVINSRNLYHYYPYYTKKPYGTGIKQHLTLKNEKFNKFKMLVSGQILKLNYISNYNMSMFNKIQQLSKWIPYNIYKYNYWNNSYNSLNILIKKNVKNLSKYIYPSKIYYKSKYQHLMSIHNHWQQFSNKLHMYYYLLYNKYNKQQVNKMNKKQKWFINRPLKHRKNRKLFAPSVSSQMHGNVYTFLHPWVLLEIYKHKHYLLPHRKNLLLKSNKPLIQTKEVEKFELINENNKNPKKMFVNKYGIGITFEQLMNMKEKVRLQQIEDEKVRLQQIEDEKARLQQIEDEKVRLQQAKDLDWKNAQEWKQRKNLKMIEKKLVQVDLGVRLDNKIWQSLSPQGRTDYHKHQKELKRKAKEMVESSSIVDNIINKNINKNNNKTNNNNKSN